MANTLTNLIPTLYASLNEVSREMVGIIPAARRDARVERAALNQSVRVPIAAAASTATNTPGTTAPDTGDETVDSAEILISKSKHVPVRFNGEETRGLENAGTYGSIAQDRFTEGFRALVNEIETDGFAAAYVAASRGYGTAATAPFGTAGDLSDMAGVARILDENGAPLGDRQLVLGYAAMANLRGTQSVLFKVNEAGSDDMLRDGMTDRIQNFAIRYSGQISAHTKGAGTSYQLAETGEVDETDLTLDTGSGTVLAGDVVTFAGAGAAQKYIVNTGVAAPGTISLGAPGLQAAEADNAAMTIGATYTPNLAFSRSAVVLAARLPAMPEGGDNADDSMIITDPVSGLSFEIAVYRQFLQLVYHIRLAWGWKVVKSAHVATLIG